MGFLDKLSKPSADTLAANSQYREKLTHATTDPARTEEEREIRRKELGSFEAMTDREKAKWVAHKEQTGGWSTSKGAAGIYAGGKCC